MSGSAALPVPVLQRWRELTGHTLLERYGMTEVESAIALPSCTMHTFSQYRLEWLSPTPWQLPSDGRAVLGCPCRGCRWAVVVLYPLYRVQVRVVGGEGELLVQGDSTGLSQQETPPGSLHVRGGNVFQRYHNRPEATAAEFTEDGWFVTGDTAQVWSSALSPKYVYCDVVMWRWWTVRCESWVGQVWTS